MEKKYFIGTSFDSVSINGMKGDSSVNDLLDKQSLIRPDPEVSEKRPRRRFTAQYKLRILEEADSDDKSCQIGVLLRREGLYSSNLSSWRRQRQKGLLQAMSPQKRGRKQKERNPLSPQVGRLEKENQRLKEKLIKAEAIIDIQKKISDILGISQNQQDRSKS